jgi:HD-GYP domain-containing protein (c-di-GMP phosphodiesterase class II)
MLLANPPRMKDFVPITIGAAAAGGLFLREHSMRTKAERLSAATLETLLNAIDANDAITGAHVRRVAAAALILGEAAGLDERTLRSIERVALFHDIGKLHGALSDIFHEQTKLTPEERRAVMTHPQRGAEVLAPLKGFFPDLPKGVAAHHERWDGTGYPRGLKGRRILLPFRPRGYPVPSHRSWRESWRLRTASTRSLIGGVTAMLAASAKRPARSRKGAEPNSTRIWLRYS